jgi:hypothetical protein
MAMTLKTFITGPEWVTVSIPEWFPTRVDALITQFGDQEPELEMFKSILAAEAVSKDAVDQADQLAGTTQHSEVFLLAIDIATHALTVQQMVVNTVPLALKAA